ncbi:hypothetical protein HDV05_003889 [Chytridiales sp. JEL 0842]|nr:hypothetical protein HDV05_003889 [Chytridiales sp. JEL 0842]
MNNLGDLLSELNNHNEDTSSGHPGLDMDRRVSAGTVEIDDDLPSIESSLRVKDAVFPSNIDDLDLSATEVVAKVANTNLSEHELRGPKKLRTIRNINGAAGKAFSAFMSNLGKKCNMHYDPEKLCWVEVDGIQSEKSEDNVEKEAQTKFPDTSNVTESTVASFNDDAEKLNLFTLVDNAMNSLAQINRSDTIMIEPNSCVIDEDINAAAGHLSQRSNFEITSTALKGHISEKSFSHGRTLDLSGKNIASLCGLTEIVPNLEELKM